MKNLTPEKENNGWWNVYTEDYWSLCWNRYPDGQLWYEFQVNPAKRLKFLPPAHRLTKPH